MTLTGLPMYKTKKTHAQTLIELSDKHKLIQHKATGELTSETNTSRNDGMAPARRPVKGSQDLISENQTYFQH